VLALRPFVTDNVLHAGTLSATIPLWFVAAYLTVIALAPTTYRWWQKAGAWSVLILGVAAIAIDIIRFSTGIEAVGWINYIFVWGFLHQIGYWWHERDGAGTRTGPGTASGMIVVGMGALVLATSLDWYPVAMVTIPGGGTTNMIPPTFANGLLGIAHAGLIALTLSAMSRMAERRIVWRVVVGASALIMTIYLWHLTALSLAGAAGIFIADGWLFSFDPGSTLWWLMRVPFFVILTVATVALIAVFGWFERSVNRTPQRLPTGLWLIGLATTIGAVSLMAFTGIVTTNARINWYIPVLVVVGAALTGSWPRSRRSAGSENPTT
jgi:hypothetical protein